MRFVIAVLTVCIYGLDVVLRYVFVRKCNYFKFYLRDNEISFIWVCHLHKEEIWIIIVVLIGAIIWWLLCTSICKMLSEEVRVIIFEIIEMLVWLGELIVINEYDSNGNRNCNSIFDICLICFTVVLICFL